MVLGGGHVSLSRKYVFATFIYSFVRILTTYSYVLYIFKYNVLDGIVFVMLCYFSVVGVLQVYEEGV